MVDHKVELDLHLDHSYLKTVEEANNGANVAVGDGIPYKRVCTSKDRYYPMKNFILY